MREVGLIKQIKDKWIPMKPLCGGQDFATIGLAEVKPIIYAFVIGIGMAIGLLIVEFITFQCMVFHKRRQMTKIHVKMSNTFHLTGNTHQLLNKFR